MLSSDSKFAKSKTLHIHPIQIWVPSKRTSVKFLFQLTFHYINFNILLNYVPSYKYTWNRLFHRMKKWIKIAKFLFLHSSQFVRFWIVYLKSIRPFFLRKPGGFQWSALAWSDLKSSYVCGNLFPPVSSVSWWQAAFKWGSV